MKANFNIEGADFLDTLLLRHHITLKMVHDCAVEQYDDINTMERIIEPKEEKDVSRFLATARILDPMHADSIIKNLREEAKKQEGRNWIANVQEPSMESYVLLIISAFVCNTPFYLMALEKCVFLKELTQSSENQKDDGKIIHFPKPGESSDRIEYKVASPAGIGFTEFETPYENEIGKLIPRHAQFDGPYLQFYFHPKTKLPDNCVIDVRFTVTGNCHTLRLYKEDEIFISNLEDGKGIDYHHGIKIESVVPTAEIGDNG